ncbi:hypothetical protein KFL_001920140 [Klebsormidium nitens]|uniref:Uncharacterized protein n=1 Tax=Klebsormidium nitens TaxID=105231 RepID=A0A1Y1I0R6_KLENI|nr:hypothetical protein KFL_001920140 [Klebsormidium nitens]|eukprot:GAQ84514.1 hypothetical protein KFL_001920140 [Klebsormidium nitens]
MIVGTRRRRLQVLSSEEEMKLIEEQRSRARKERLLQVRRQDTILAAHRVREFRAQVTTGQQRLAQQLENQWQLERQQKIEELEAELAAALADVGRSQRQAQDAVEEKAKRAEAAAVQAVENLRNAQARFQGALREEQSRRTELQAEQRAAEARRKAMEETMRMERALAQIAARNAELRQRAEAAAAATREPRILPVIDDLDAFRFTCLHRQLLERTPLTNIPGAENAPPQQVVKFPPPNVHIKGLDDSRVAAEVERRRIEAEKERRERERRETHSRTVEREAAAHFRIGVWRQRKEAAIALARSRRAEGLERQRALFPIDEEGTLPTQPLEQQAASLQEEIEGLAAPSGRPGERPTAAVSDERAPVQAASARPEPAPAEAATAQASTSSAELDGPSGASSEAASAQRPETAPEEIEVLAQDSRERHPGGSVEPRPDGSRAEQGAGTEEGAAAEADEKVGAKESSAGASGAETRRPPLPEEAGHVSADGGPGVQGEESGVRVSGGLGGWLPRIGEDSPFVERGGQARGDLRGPSEELVNSSRAEDVRGGGQEGAAGRVEEAAPDFSEEVPGMDLREVLEQLVALEDARSGDAREALRILDERADLTRPHNPEEGGRGAEAPRRAEGTSELRQSLEEFIVLERELYEKEQQKERLRGRLESGVGVRDLEGSGQLETQAKFPGERGRNRGEERRDDGLMDRQNEGGVVSRALGTASAAPKVDVSIGAVPGSEALSGGASGLAADQLGLANPGGLEGLEVNTARQRLGHWGLDYASSDFTLMSSPTSGLSPFSLLTSPLSNFSEDDLDVLLDVHVSSFALGPVSGSGDGATLREGETAEFREQPGLGLNAGEELHSAEGQVTSGTGFDTELSARRTEGEENERTREPDGAKEHVSSSAPTSSSLLTSGDTMLSGGTGLSNRTELEAGALLPSSELTTSGTVPSTDLPPTSTTERSETGAAEAPFPSGHSSPGSQTAPTYPPSSPGVFQPVPQTLDTGRASAPGDFEPTSEEEQGHQPVTLDLVTEGVFAPSNSEPNAEKQQGKRAAAIGNLPGERERPVDDIFARLKRELDEFDERLDAVRADVFAQGGAAARLPSSTSGLPSTPTTSTSDGNARPPLPPSSQSKPSDAPAADVSTEGRPADVALPPVVEAFLPGTAPPERVADATLTSTTIASLLAATLTVSSFSLTTSGSSPVSQSPHVNPAGNPHVHRDVRASPDSASDSEGPHAQKLDPSDDQQSEDADVTALDGRLNFDMRAAEPSAETGRPSIAAALGLSETSSEESEAAETERTALGETGKSGEGSSGKSELSSNSAISSPEGGGSTLAGREFREAAFRGAEQERSAGESNHSGKSPDAGDLAPFVESSNPSSPALSERLSPSDQSLTTTWQYRSSSLLAAPAAYQTGTQMAPLSEEWSEGFRALEEGVSEEESLGAAVPRSGVEVRSVSTERQAGQGAERKDGRAEAAAPVAGPSESRAEAEFHEEALSLAPLPLSPRLLPSEDMSSNHWQPPPLQKPKAHFAEDLLRRSLSPPAAAQTFKPPNVAAALALLDRPSELLTFDEQLEALAGELRKLDQRLHVATSQSVSSLLGSGPPDDGSREVYREGVREKSRDVGDRRGSPGDSDAVRRDEAGGGASADVTSPTSGDTAGVSSVMADDASPQAGTADVSGGEADANSPLREDSDVRSGAPLHGTEAERSGSGDLSKASELRTEPENSASPEQRRALPPVAGRVDIASLSSVGWAAALDIDGPDSLLAGSADFSPWRGSDVSDPSPAFGRLAKGGTGMQSSVPFSEPAFGRGLTASEKGIEAEGEEYLSPYLGNSLHGSDLQSESGGVRTDIGKAAGRGGSGVLGQQEAGGQEQRIEDRKTPQIAKLSSSRPTVAEQRPVSASGRATASAAGKGMVAGKGTFLAARSRSFSPLPKPPRNKARSAERTRQSGPANSAGRGGKAPSPSAELRKQAGGTSLVADSGLGAVRSPSKVSGPGGNASSAGRRGTASIPPAELRKQRGEFSPAADGESGAVRSPSRESGPPTPSSVTSSWSSITSGLSARVKEPGRRFEDTLRAGAEEDPGGRPGSKEEAEKRKRAIELKEKALAFDKEQRDKRRRSRTTAA